MTFYFIIGSLYLFTPFTYFIYPLPLATTSLVSVFVLFFFFSSQIARSQYLSLSVIALKVPQHSSF